MHSLCCCFYMIRDYLYYLKASLPETWKSILMDSVLCVHNQLISYTWAKPGHLRDRVSMRNDSNTALLKRKASAMFTNIYQKRESSKHDTNPSKESELLVSFSELQYPTHPLNPSQLLFYWSVCQKYSWLYRSLAINPASSLRQWQCIFVIMLSIILEMINYRCMFCI